MKRFWAWWVGLASAIVALGLLMGLALVPRLAPSMEDGVTAYINRDFVKARTIFKAFADDGDPVAQFYLGDIYRLGQGTKKDEAKAFGFYKKGANGGSSEAQYALGMCYATGVGGTTDYVEAYRWLSLSIIRLSPWDKERRDLAIKTRDIILKAMPQADVDKAKALVIAWDRNWTK